MKLPAKAAASIGAGALALAAVFIPKWEGWKNEPYADGAGLATVCIGHLGAEQRRYSDAECRDIFRKDLELHAAQIAPCVPPTAPVEVQAAFLSLGFNVGPTALCGSSAARKLNAGDLAGACDALLAWNKLRDPKTHQLVVSKGLSNRRADERALCRKGLAQKVVYGWQFKRVYIPGHIMLADPVWI